MKKDLQCFLGVVNYYQRFVPWFLSRAGPLTDLLAGKGKGTQLLNWMPEARNRGYSDSPMYECGPLSPTSQSPLCHKCLQRELGGGVNTGDPHGEQPVFFLSRKLNKADWNYAAIKKEALAIHWGREHFKYYLWERQFTVVTDHAPPSMAQPHEGDQYPAEAVITRLATLLLFCSVSEGMEAH